MKSLMLAIAVLAGAVPLLSQAPYAPPKPGSSLTDGEAHAKADEDCARRALQPLP